MIEKNFGLVKNATNGIRSSQIDDALSGKGSLIIGFSGLLMVCVGILTNSLNLIVLSRKTMKSTTNKYLSTLAVCDLFVLVFSQLSVSNNFIYYLKDSSDLYISLIINEHSDHNSSQTAEYSIHEQIIKIYHKWAFYIYPKLYPYVYPVAIMFQVCTVLINLGMSTDRFVAIHFPLKSLNFCTIKCAKRVILYIFIFSFLYSLPRFFEYYVHVEQVAMSNETFTIVYNDFTTMGQSSTFRTIIYVYMYILFQSVVPLVLLSFINLALLVSLKKSGNKLRKFSVVNENTKLDSIKSSSLKFCAREINKRKDITLMLVTVVLLFVVFQSPAVVCNCFYGSNNYRQEFAVKEANSYHTVCQIGNVFILAGSSLNFFTYCWFNRKFRYELTRCLRRVLCMKTNLRDMHQRLSATTQNSFLIQTSNHFHNSVRTNSSARIKLNDGSVKKFKFKYMENLKAKYMNQNSCPEQSVSDLRPKSNFLFKYWRTDTRMSIDSFNMNNFDHKKLIEETKFYSNLTRSTIYF
ncbi:FMRFamide receptor-like [Brachionus plicatilis]|uniref:FMRFamide receptor-like n=1 Tax=Brachionus plicatilis TaxID=10195 RepID=A0A3M7T993_BRAPC|nr:FMRFamide receptor-like [Brachionus plicatilis]